MNSEANRETPSRDRLIDQVDRQILALLAEDARLSVRELARRLGAAPKTISDRMSRLEEDNILVGYHARFANYDALGFGLHAMIGIELERLADANETIDSLFSLAEVRTIRVVTGEWDLLVEVYTSDRVHLRDVILNWIWQTPGFRRAETMVVLDRRDRAHPPILFNSAG